MDVLEPVHDKDHSKYDEQLTAFIDSSIEEYKYRMKIADEICGTKENDQALIEDIREMILTYAELMNNTTELQNLKHEMEDLLSTTNDSHVRDKLITTLEKLNNSLAKLSDVIPKVLENLRRLGIQASNIPLSN
jgi:membrane-associated HD superfamily phosphohydrolase